MTEEKRKVGGQPGNQNAKKVNPLYKPVSVWFTKEEYRILEREARMRKISIYRVVRRATCLCYFEKRPE